MPAISAKTRAATALTATSAKLSVGEVKELVKAATSRTNTRGGGASVLTSGVANVGAGIHVEGEADDGLLLAVHSAKKIMKLCTFPARVGSSDGETLLVVGGLHQYSTKQPKLLYFIPAGPKFIVGFDPYKRFLDQVANDLRARDPQAKVSISAPQ